MSELHKAESYNNQGSDPLPLHVVAFANLTKDSADIITTQGGRLMRGLRVVVRSIEKDANAIAGSYDLTTKAYGPINPVAKKGEPLTTSQGFSVTPVFPHNFSNIADFTQGTLPINHEFDLELHNYHTLLQQLELESDDPLKRLDAAYLRSFGKCAIKESGYRKSIA
jgi:hypothetical protein